MGKVASKSAAIGIAVREVYEQMLCLIRLWQHNIQVQPACCWKFLVISN
ncbi:hypothetical protein FHU10_3931 [Serratia fonticola]|uniref:Uncharacterized protein n=1 Tax=Serratia fonticola TaxID=47917 RepID=A0A542BRK3_SERFO|nr:hypothetical protein FHU09_3774 [Serratia fonticola]TQI96810.1 hypothetical protein FHU11_2271 [Serratia fonticola]TVZ71306.1 hypothetical protein FHU10_3931 [Serratia fonticola]